MGIFTLKKILCRFKVNVCNRKKSLLPLGFLIHEGSPADVKIFPNIIEELKEDDSCEILIEFFWIRDIIPIQIMWLL